MKKDPLRLIAFVIALTAYCFVTFGLPYVFPEQYTLTHKTAEVVISSGMTAKEAAAAIKNAGLVLNSDELVKQMVKIGLDRRIKPGIYKLRGGSSASLAEQLETVTPQNAAVMIIPGMRYKGVAKALFGSEDAAERLTEALSDDANFPEQIREKLPEKPEDRLAFLLPETYFTVPDEKAGQSVVRRASKLWWEKVGTVAAESRDKDELLEIAVLASIVEGEAKMPEERPILAGIFKNRTERNMRLQSCATVMYAWDEAGIKKNSLTYDDLKIESPYNTYLHGGLPPGPISVPSIGSWQSAVNPAHTKYLFFFARADGSHRFSETYTEHLKRQRESGN